MPLPWMIFLITVMSTLTYIYEARQGLEFLALKSYLQTSATSTTTEDKY